MVVLRAGDGEAAARPNPVHEAAAARAPGVMHGLRRGVTRTCLSRPPLYGV